MTQSSSIDAYLRPSKHSETLLINQLSQTREKNNQLVYKFGFGQSPFPVPQTIAQSLSDSAHRKEYMSVQGHAPLRRAICSFHNKLEGKTWDAERVVIGAGSKILLFCIMAAFERAEILLPAPSWVSYEPQGKLAGHKVTWLETDFAGRWVLSASALEEYCAARSEPELPLILVLNSPSNPSGQSYSATELKALALVMKKYKVIVIADEIYSLLSYQKDYASIADYYPEGSIVSSGLSKWCGAGGWRLGFIHIPAQLGENLLQAVIGIASETYSCAPSPIQVAATKAYQDVSLAKNFLSKQAELLRLISGYCSDQLINSGVQVHAAEGGFYLFPDFSAFRQKLLTRGIATGEQLTATIMQETGVALLPGNAFGMPAESLTARLAFVDFDGSQIWHRSDKQFEFDRIRQGIGKLCDWLGEL